MEKFTFIHLEWNSWNGFIFDFIGFEMENSARSLFAIWGLTKRVGIHIFFIEFEIGW